jgi:acetyl-CoA carboxylase biotin carboxyl carrier protein
MARTPAKVEVDGDLVRRLAELLDETGLSEIEYGRDGWHVRVAKGGIAVQAAPQTLQPAPTPAASLDASHPGAVTAPMVGVVYTAPEPGDPPYVKVGDAVVQGQVVLLIEAMKVFNSIEAPRAGTVTQILVASGMPVEYGEPLLVIE